MECIRFAIIAGLVAVGSTLSTAHANNNEQKGFWKKGAATDWKSPVHDNSSHEIIYRDYPLAVDSTKLRLEEEAKKTVENAQKTIDSQKASPADPADEKQTAPLTREEIVAKYGAPSEPHPIKAQKDSPPEMQALFAALNSGDKELAWQYSVALAERNARMQQMVSKVSDLQLLAFEATGQRPAENLNPESDEVGATRLEYGDLMERTKLELLKKKFEADKLLNAQEAEQGGVARLLQPPAAPSRIPVDPAGKVKLLIFFDENDSKVAEFSKSLKPLEEKFKSDANVSVVGLTIRSYALPGLKKVASRTSFPFGLVNGEALAPELRIQRYPTFVFLAVTSKETYHLEGMRGADEIEKVLNVMKGQAK